MPTLPLYTLPDNPEGWHQTIAPGGYESWKLTFFDAATNTLVWAALMSGCPYHREYLRTFERYSHDPTRIAPLLPWDVVCVHLAVFQNGRPLAETLTQYPRYSFQASTDFLDVRLGMDRLWRTPESLRLSARGRPISQGKPSPGLLQLELTLFTITPPARLIPFNGSAKSSHLWAPLASPCTAKGQVTLYSSKNSPAQTIPLTGRASMDHELGVAPLSPDFTSWLSGTAFLPHDVIPLQFAVPGGASARAQAAMFNSDGRPMGLGTVHSSWSDSKRPYPTGIEFSPQLRLDSPQLLPSAGPIQHLIYRATTPDQQTGHAVCQLLRPGETTSAFHKPLPAQG